VTSNRVEQATARIRALDLTDIPACRAIARSRDWTDSEAKWRLLLDAGQGFGVEGPGGALHAVVIITHFPPGMSVIGMLLVDAAHGRQGLGGALMRHILDYASGQVVCLYATTFGQPLYERMDFRIDSAVVRHAGRFRPAPDDAPAPGLQVGLLTAADREELRRLDRSVFGADRSAFLTALAGTADRVVVARDARGVAGYAALAWTGEAAATIGPVIARDDAVASALISAVVAGHDGPVQVDLPRGRTELSHWAQSHGLTPSRSIPLMVLHGCALPGERANLYAPALLGVG
jgi:GNAT superfamily N-acetyltransferase